MKHLVLFLSLIILSAALTACNMDRTGGMEQGNTSMDGDNVYEPNWFHSFTNDLGL